MARLGLHPGGLMPLMGHLTELRRALIISAVAFVVMAGGIMIYANRILEFMLVPLNQLHIVPIQTKPMEYLFVMLKISTIGGLFLALPVILWQVYSFARPALKPHERRYVLILLPITVLLFVGGVVLAYFSAYRVALRFLVTLGEGVVTPYITISEFINFTISFLLPFGLVFEMPMVSMFLTRIGIITPGYLAGKRKYAFFFIFVLAIILIPDPSLFTQSMLAVPMYVLFEVSILLSRLVQRRKLAARVAEPALDG
ncbi:MAG: twin-arginine translocase subunit TatC [Peptococcaceae bacterium]|nr:twin-arginine translocase subunit TatC [Peptococcaceae bacterium]